MRYNVVPVSEIIEEMAMGPFGSNIKVECFVDSGIPVLNGSNVDGTRLSENEFRYVTKEKADSLGKASASRGDIVITHRGTLGQVAYIPENSRYDRYIISQSQFRIRCKANKALPEFVVYYFHTREGQHQILSNKSQVGVPALGRPTSTFQNLSVPLPSLTQQKEIAATLSCLDNKIELNNKINANLEAQAQAIFKSWFVDFEPFQDGEFVDSELGMIPQGWRVGTLAEIIVIYDSKRIPLSGRQREHMEKVYPYYGAASLMDYVDDYIFDGVYVLLGEDGTVITNDGYPILQYVWGKFWVNNHAHILKGASGYSEGSLFILLMNTSVISAVTGAVQPKISQQNLKSIKIIIPDEVSITRFNDVIAPIFDYRRKVLEENRTLAAIRDALLPKLMSGEIEVPLAE